MLRELHEENLHTSYQCKTYLGKIFKGKLLDIAPWADPLNIANFILNQCILIHLDKHEDKFNMLCFMVKKLFSFVQDKCKV